MRGSAHGDAAGTGRRDVRHTWLSAGHSYAARDEQPERKCKKETLVNRALEEQPDEAIEIHRTT